MDIPVVWENDEKTILRFDERVPWTWAEFDQAVDRLVTMMRSVNHTVHILVFSPERFPSGFPLVHFQRVVLLLPPNTGLIVLLNNTPFQRRLNHILMTIFPGLKKQLVFVDTVEEAYQAFTERARVR
jgi:hypothetical protein